MKRILSIITLFALMGTLHTTEAQNSDIELSLEQGHEMKIDGTSNVRDWDADVNTVNATFVLSQFDLSDLSSLTADHFKTMELSIPVEDIESDSGRLTRNLQDYLKKDDHPIITFTMNEVESVEINGNSADIVASGVINAAGVDHETSMNVTATVNNGKVTFSGTQDLLMTDFGIDPPTAMLGSIRARDEITIIYSLTFSN
ncbi:YceI family protein [Rhodohalobacter sp. SW132]|uniref:YceI family protein n=1 Tax=Rhodohalobacter sp. SW132 TaxID=2293433 RepID=UPI000E25CC40|nr:YceI family protein [Rhodohalobacter sp. SW132]REL33207.1 YceI family protein [Rhodohalobacter sp. SW132]